MYRIHKGRFLFGALILLLVALVGTHMRQKAEKQIQLLQNTAPLKAESLSSINLDDTVVIEGNISNQTRTVYKNLVFACEEYYYSGEDGGWEVENEYPNTRVLLDVSSNFSVPVSLTWPCPRGNYTQIYDPGNSNRRYNGYSIGIPLTVVAEVVGQKPLKLETILHHTGKRQDVIRSTQSDILFQKIMAGFFVITGLLISLWPHRN